MLGYLIFCITVPEFVKVNSFQGLDICISLWFKILAVKSFTLQIVIIKLTGVGSARVRKV